MPAGWARGHPYLLKVRERQLQQVLHEARLLADFVRVCQELLHVHTGRVLPQERPGLHHVPETASEKLPKCSKRASHLQNLKDTLCVWRSTPSFSWTLITASWRLLPQRAHVAWGGSGSLPECGTGKQRAHGSPDERGLGSRQQSAWCGREDWALMEARPAGEQWKGKWAKTYRCNVLLMARQRAELKEYSDWSVSKIWLENTG